mgnify:CR=1 FL=1
MEGRRELGGEPAEHLLARRSGGQGVGLVEGERLEEDLRLRPPGHLRQPYQRSAGHLTERIRVRGPGHPSHVNEVRSMFHRTRR